MSPPHQPARSRRVGKESSKTRDEILDGVEALVYESGYAAVTYRAVATRSGVTPSLVQYYFPTLDELLVAAVRRRSEQSLRRLDKLLRDRPHEPLHVLWEFSTDETNAKLTIEFSALGNHREAVRTEIIAQTNRLRAAQMDALDHTDLDDQLPPAAALFLLSGIPKMLRMEEDFDIRIGHAAVVDLIERWLDQVEPGT